jgi:hypothetical protein
MSGLGHRTSRLALLVDRQHAAILNAALQLPLRRAGMRQSACLEKLDLSLDSRHLHDFPDVERDPRLGVVMGREASLLLGHCS